MGFEWLDGFVRSSGRAAGGSGNNCEHRWSYLLFRLLTCSSFCLLHDLSRTLGDVRIPALQQLFHRLRCRRVTHAPVADHQRGDSRIASALVGAVRSGEGQGDEVLALRLVRRGEATIRPGCVHELAHVRVPMLEQGQ